MKPRGSNTRGTLRALFLTAALLSATMADAAELRVSAAMSLAPALRQVIALFEAEIPGKEVSLNASSSGRLRMQIEGGAPVDVFISASSREMDHLESGGMLTDGSRVDVLSNELVLIVPRGTPGGVKDLGDLAGPRAERIALGSPRSVPVGMYAEEALRHFDLWDRLSERYVFTEHVRQVLDYVARGEVDAGFVYRTDAANRSDLVSIVLSLPPESHQPIVYPAAIIAGTPAPEHAAAFLRFLATDPAQGIFRAHGFTPVHNSRGASTAPEDGV